MAEDPEVFRSVAVFLLCFIIFTGYAVFIVWYKKQWNRPFGMDPRAKIQKIAQKHQIEELDFHRITLNSTILGKGSYGIVMKGTLLNPRRPPGIRYTDELPEISEVAIKQALGATRKSLHKQVEEFERHCQLNNKNKPIVEVKGFCFHKLFGPMLLFEYLKGGSLRQYLNNLWRANEAGSTQALGVRYPEYSYATALSVCRTLAEAVAFVHERSFIHCDIADRNVLLSSTNLNEAQVKLGDFGLSVEEWNSEQPSVVPPEYLNAPRCPGDTAMCKASDVWAFGVLMWRILTVGAPMKYHNITTDQLCQSVQTEQSPRTLARLPDGEVPPNLHWVMRACLGEEGETPTMEAVLRRLEDLQPSADFDRVVPCLPVRYLNADVETSRGQQPPAVGLPHAGSSYRVMPTE